MPICLNCAVSLTAKKVRSRSRPWRSATTNFS